MNGDHELLPVPEPFFARAACWIDGWLAVRWRAYITWIILAAASGLTLELELTRWLERVIDLISNWLLANVGYSPPTRIIVMCHIFVLLSWFQPVALRLGAVRVLFWMIAYSALGIAAVFISMSRQPGRDTLLDLLLVGHLCGFPGLVAIGARTRPWLTFVGAAAALILLKATNWKMTSVGSGSLMLGMIIANLAYGAVMVYGTERRDSRITDRWRED